MPASAARVRAAVSATARPSTCPPAACQARATAPMVWVLPVPAGPTSSLHPTPRGQDLAGRVGLVDAQRARLRGQVKRRPRAGRGGAVECGRRRPGSAVRRPTPRSVLNRSAPCRSIDAAARHRRGAARLGCRTPPAAVQPRPRRAASVDWPRARSTRRSTRASRDGRVGVAGRRRGSR